MTNSTPTSILSADRAITHPKDDLLGYAPFSNRLANSISTISPSDGLVIAIYGPWGSGKTSVLNLVSHYIGAREPGAQPIVVVQFNPWWFSGHEDLAKRLLDQLQATVSKWSRVVKGLAEPAAELAKLVELISEDTSSIGTMGKIGAHLFRQPQKRDIPAAKAKVGQTLGKQEKRILVVIDDIDRLTAEEIRQLFSAVKGLADLPNVIYLMAFDKAVVVQALGSLQGVPGESYLEKIVQVPFELPPPDKDALRRLLFGKLDAIVAGSPDDLFDATYWNNIYLESVDHFISTPRDVVRLTNALSTTYPAVRGEVNVVDFLALETLRLFCSRAYTVIREAPAAFAGYGDDTRDRQDLKPYHDSWLNELPLEDREPVKRLVLRIFPRLQSVWGDRYFRETGWGSQWRKQLRACTPEALPVYFRLSLPEGSISTTETKAILALAGDAQAFGARLVELAGQRRPDGTSRARAFLERVRDYADHDIPSPHVQPILRAFFDVGDQLLLPGDQRPGMMELGNEFRIGLVVQQLLLRLDEQCRSDALRESLSSGRATAIIAREVAILGQQYERYGGTVDRASQHLVRLCDIIKLEAIALAKIREAAEQGILLRTPTLSDILLRWADWSGPEEVKRWVGQAIRADDALPTFLEHFLQVGYTLPMSDVVGKSTYTINLKQMEPFVEPADIFGRTRQLSHRDDWTERQSIAVEEFNYAYQMRLQGQEGNDPLA